MTLPNFLLIGAMKAGTTTLYEDLLHVDGIYLPPEKEPNDLAFPEVETAPGLARYEAKFAAGAEATARGDASTAYAKLPTHEGVAARARRLLGPDLRILYMTRDPIKRIVSHYHHLHSLGLETRPLNVAVREDDTYVAYSQYDRQLAPWQEVFGPDNILVTRFEDYISDRQVQLERICAFLGVAPPPHVAETHRNKSDGTPIVKAGSSWARLAQSDFYLYKIKPLLPTQTRDAIKALLLPKAPGLDETLSEDSLRILHQRLGSK